MTIVVLQALAISHRSGLQMAIVSHVLVHNTCYHFIALVGWEGGALVIQVLPSSYNLKTLAADDDHDSLWDQNCQKINIVDCCQDFVFM